LLPVLRWINKGLKQHAVQPDREPDIALLKREGDVTDAEVVQGAERSTMDALAELTESADKLLVF
jgi:succinylarginine dihydrolase